MKSPPRARLTPAPAAAPHTEVTTILLMRLRPSATAPTLLMSPSMFTSPPAWISW